jgi:long-chain fatty acid transport protein
MTPCVSWRCAAALPFTAATLLSAATAWAGGFKIPDQSTRAMGMADAFVAGADDASAVYYNPAGLTHLRQAELIGNLYLAHADVVYNGPDGHERSDGRYYAVPNFYLAGPVSADQRLFLGLGVYSPFGLGSRWGDRSAVRHYTTLAEIQLLNVNPTVACRVTDRLSLGLGVNYFRSRAISRRINQYGPFGEGEVDVDAEGDGWGWNAGLQYRLSEPLTLGLTYRSPVSVDYRGDAQFDQLPEPLFGRTRATLPASSTLDFPASAAAGLQWRVTPRWRLECAAEWTQWSTRDQQSLRLNVPPGLPIPARQNARLDWRDSWLLMVGTEHDVGPRWTLRAGYGYNQTPAPAATADPSLPTGDTHALALGAGFRLNARATLDLAYILGYGTRRTLTNNNAPHASTYESLSHHLSAGLTWRF